MRKKIMLVVLVFVMALGIFLFAKISETIEASKDLSFQNVDMNKIEDGTYLGEAVAGMVNVSVEVTVKHHEIQDIRLLKHETGLGGKAEVILNTMVEKNTTEVDIVSGATVSSRVIRKASEQALLQTR